jgi:hypothetical protein
VYYVRRILAWKLDFIVSSNNGSAQATAPFFLKSLRADNGPYFFVIEIRDVQ